MESERKKSVGVEDGGQIPNLRKQVLWRPNHHDQEGRDNQVRMKLGLEKKEKPIKNKTNTITTHTPHGCV